MTLSVHITFLLDEASEYVHDPNMNSTGEIFLNVLFVCFCEFGVIWNAMYPFCTKRKLQEK